MLFDLRCALWKHAALWGVAPALALIACGSDGPASDGFAGAGGSATVTNASSGGGGLATVGATGGLGLTGGSTGTGAKPMGPFSDFPSMPILDAEVGGQAPPPAVVSLFGPAGSGDATGGPCLFDPAPGTLFPSNWVRPRFAWTPGAGQNLFELRIRAGAKNEVNDLVVYTTKASWTMPKAMWTSLTSNVPDVPLTVTIRGAVLAGTTLMGNPAVGVGGTIQIAPADAAGSIVYWRTIDAMSTGELKGFSAGDESVVLALQAAQVAVKPGGTAVACLGCHTSTPDGAYAAFKTLDATAGGALASVEKSTTGQAPSFWSMASIDAMNAADFGVPSFSKAHWQAGDRTLLTSWQNDAQAELAWFDLEANASGQGVAFDVLPRDGDPNGAIMPSFSHDGTKIVYTSTTGSQDGRPTSQPTDLYTVPYAAKKGGAATPLNGAADPMLSEYYPAFSPDDKFVAFNRISSGSDTYDQASAEVFVIPAAGGTATRLDANDPASCSGQMSPGVTNSWPKWAPEAVTVGDRTFYWVAFSSKRAGGVPQLYITAIVEQGSTVTTYPALYVWPQPPDEANHTPAWDVFQIPKAPPPK